jgi:HEAT repeat protein
MSRATLAGTCVVTLLLAGNPATALDWAGKIQRDRKDLRSTDVAVRLGALERLAHYHDSQVNRLIIQALDDVDPRVQRLAASLAADRRLREAVPILMRWLTHWEDAVRLSAAQNLGRIGDGRAVRSLVRALVDPDLKVRLAVIKALGKLSTPTNHEVVPLLGRLRDTNAKVRRAAVEVLASKKDRRAVIPLLGRLGDSAREVVIAAVQALGEIGDPGAGPSLVRLLRDPSADVVSAALDTLGKLRYNGATEALVDLFKSASVEHRSKAAAALAKLATDQAIAALVSALGSPTLQGAAKAALAEAGPRASAHLVELINNPRTARPVAVAAVEIARDARIEAAVPGIIQHVRAGRLPLLLLVRTLGTIGASEGQRTLLDLLAHPSPEVRLAALDALRPVVDERAAEPLIKLLDSQSRRVQITAVEYLGRLRSRGATPRLMRLATSTSRRVARAAVRALSLSRDPRAIPVLVQLLGHRDRTMRRFASQALARIHDPGALTPLLRLCQDSLAGVRVVCLQALGGILRGRSDDAALALLVNVIKGNDRSAFLAATDALAAMRDRRIPPLLIERYADLDPVLKRRVIDVLGSDPSYTSVALPFLLKVLGTGAPELKAGAAWALGKLGNSQAERQLALAARDSSWMVRANAVAALARLRAGSARSLLRMLVTDSVPYVRANAALGLGWLNDRGAARLLHKRLLDDRSPWVRLNAMRAVASLGVPLKGSGSPRQIATRMAKEDADPRVRAMAGRLLRARASRATSWIGMYLVDREGKPARNAPVVLVTPGGLLRVAFSDPRGELWEENLPEGACYAELPPASLLRPPSKN